MIVSASGQIAPKPLTIMKPSPGAHLRAVRLLAAARGWVILALHDRSSVLVAVTTKTDEGSDHDDL